MESSTKSRERTLLTVSMISGKLLALLGAFTLPLFLTRFLSREEYGIFSQYFVIVFFCTEFFSFSLDSNLYFFYRGEMKKTGKS
jgi:O-antigen/teichoic acid export membrane protein